MSFGQTVNSNIKGVTSRVVLDTVLARDTIPEEVNKEINALWTRFELGNDVCYFWFDVSEEEHQEDYPKICEFLKSIGIQDCLIHKWW